MYTRKIYGKNIQGHNLRVARYLLITFLLQSRKIHTISLNSYPCRTSEKFLYGISNKYAYFLILNVPKNLHLRFAITDSAGISSAAEENI